MIRRKLFAVILAGIITAAASGGAAANDARVERVLYLNSYNRGYRWSDDIERGLRERLKHADHQIELSVEYLDGRRFPGTARNDLLAATLAAKYAGYRQDIVVVSDNFAFDFALQYRKQLFPDLPIVFCGYNNFRPDVLKGIRNITGINEKVNFAKTVELAVRIQPAVRNLVFITSTSDDSNRRMSKVVEDTLFPELRKGYNLIVLKDASMAEIGSRLGALPPDSAVFLVGMTSDSIKGRRPTAVENSRMIAAVSPVPVYSFWDFALGTGILGGHIITGLDQGRAAADMVLRILGGTPADSIPVMMQTPARNVIDFNVMKKYGIEVNDLPKGCAFINRPVSLWESYGWYIGAALLAISLESLLIIALVLSLRQRKEAFRMVGIERDQLEQRVEARTGELQRTNELLEAEIGVRNRTERVITARLRLLEFAATHSLDELLEATINEAEALTGSFIGFYHFLEADQKTLSLQNWSTKTKAQFCKAEGKGLHYDLSQAGVWADCVRQRRPVIHNNLAGLPHRKGMPPPHAEVIRELVLPVFRSDSIVAIIGVGNKPHDYTAADIEAVSFLADLAWEITERKQAEEILHLSRFCIDKAGIGIYQSDENGTIFSANEYACNILGYTKAELCALSIFDIDPEISPERMLELKEIIDEKGLVTHYTTHRHRDGSAFPVEITANYIDFRGKRYGISFAKDITDRKRAEEELKRQKQLLEDLNSTLEERVREVHRLNETLEERVAERTAELENRAQQLQRLALELTNAEDRERRRIASILHDDFQQELAYIKLELVILQKEADLKAIQQRLDFLVPIIADCIEKSRNLSYEINPPALTQNGLIVALGALAHNMKIRFGLHVTVNTQQNADPHSIVLASVLFRSIRELLFNVIKHACVNRASLDVGCQNGMIHIRIEDLGKGFVYDPARPRGHSKTGFGLWNIEDRITFLGGRMEIKTAPGKGCRIELTVPKDVSRKDNIR